VLYDNGVAECFPEHGVDGLDGTRRQPVAVWWGGRTIGYELA